MAGTHHSLEPLALVGAAPGLSIVARKAVLTRLNYFDGKFLRADDLRLEQDYMRSLVALSNRATGSGLAYGFDVEGPDGDAFVLAPGLGVTPNGQVVHLSGEVTISIPELLRRSGEGSFDPDTQPTPGGAATFEPCPPMEPDTPDAVVEGSALYVITVAPADAYCGEEERFGNLCEDACLTETDRPKIVEGVRVRARRLLLEGLPRSTTFTFTLDHLRSRVASAYFAAEAAAIPSLISGAGLSNPAWCHGAQAVDGNEIPVAVLARSGSATVFLDEWTARRELTEAPARRWWAWRMSMRPWNVFLAQIFHFQCQLAGFTDRTVPVGPGDPCAGEREALRAANDIFGEFTKRWEAITDAGDDALAALDAEGLAELNRFMKVADLVSGVLATPTRSPSGSLLLDRGIVELPSAGYLPVDPAGSVQDQVAAWMGPGVDLRFCAVRSDYVPHALEEAQHMERISLTAGLDDPEAKPRVDILVPDGIVEDVAGTKPAVAYSGTLQVFPRRHAEEERLGHALKIPAVAREGTSPLDWALAAFGEAPDDQSVPALLLALAAELGLVSRRHRVFEGLEALAFAPDEGDAGTRSLEEIALLANRERVYARRRRAEAGYVGDRWGREAIPEYGLDEGQARPVAFWAAASVDGDPFAAERNARLGARLRLSATSRSREGSTTIDLRVDGTLLVGEAVRKRAPDGSESVVVDTVFEGTTDPLVVGPDIDDRGSEPVSVRNLRWRFHHTAQGVRAQIGVLREGPSLFAGRQGDDVSFAFGYAQLLDFDRTVLTEIGGDRREVLSRLIETPEEWTGTRTTIDVPAFEFPVADPIFLGRGTRRDGALEPGAPERDLAEAAVEAIGAALVEFDPGFADDARARFFGSAASALAAHRVRATRDWVLFHRRRDIDCESEITPATPVRRYRVYHALVAAGDLDRLSDLHVHYATTPTLLPGVEEGAFRVAGLAAMERSVGLPYVPIESSVADLGFQLVGTVEFEGGTATLRSSLSDFRDAWVSGDRGTHLVYRAVSDIGTTDGESVAVDRAGALVSAVADTIDTSGAPPTEYLVDVPPEFRATGVDGVVLTAGVSRRQPPTGETCHEVYKIGKTQTGRLMDAFAGLDFVTADLLQSLLQELDIGEMTTAKFETPTNALLNEDDVRAWWAEDAPGGAILLSPEDDPAVEAQARVALEALGVAAPGAIPTFPGRGSDCPAALFLYVRRWP